MQPCAAATRPGQERSEVPRGSFARPPRDELMWTEVITLRSAERRPARDDLPPRRIRATVPAHSKPACTGAVLLQFDSLIDNPHV
jgi:hypothetical protein